MVLNLLCTCVCIFRYVNACVVTHMLGARASSSMLSFRSFVRSLVRKVCLVHSSRGSGLGCVCVLIYPYVESV